MFPKDTITLAKNITCIFGKGYYRATLFFPSDIRKAIWILYAFVRIPDEMVDTEKDVQKGKNDLTQWIADWQKVRMGDTEDKHPILIATKTLFDHYSIPYEYSDAFLQIMMTDFSITTYAKYEDLESYMYGSAAVVGLMISHIIGFKDSALPHARALGEAMQLTNFLRDVGEDIQTRGRIYLPQEDMDRFGVTSESIIEGRIDDAWKSLMKFEIQRARTLFSFGNKGIPLLQGNGRRAVTIASVLYEGILDEIEKQDYDVFTKRASTSSFRKAQLITKTVWNQKK